MMETIEIIVFLLYIPTAKTHFAGSFFWHPRLGLHLAPNFVKLKPEIPPAEEYIRNELVVIIRGYSMGVTVIAIAEGYRDSTKPLKHLSLLHAPFYTNAYRWSLRHINLIPQWLGPSSGRYTDTHKVWRRRYSYMDEFVPKWMRYLTPWIKKNEWVEEEKEFQGYIKYAESIFGRYRYPNKKFTNFTSEATKETVAISD